MANIQKLTYPYFTDGTTQLNAANLNPIIAKLNEVIDKVNGGTPTPTPTVNAPTIYIRDLAIIMDAESGASIYYTTDGSTPTASSTQYTNAFTLPNNATVKAIAIKNGSSSSVASASFTAPQRSTQDAPQVVIEGNKVTMLSNGVGSIRYAFDDSSTYNVYSEPLTLNSPTLIKFRTVEGTTIRSGRVNFTGTDNIKVSMRYITKLMASFIAKASSTESSLVLNTSENFGRHLKFYKIANSRNYAFDASVLSTTNYGYWGYCNSVPESITGETSLAGKLPSYGSATGSDVSFEITSENFQYIAVSGGNNDYMFEFAEII